MTTPMSKQLSKYGLVDLLVGFTRKPSLGEGLNHFILITSNGVSCVYAGDKVQQESPMTLSCPFHSRCGI